MEVLKTDSRASDWSTHCPHSQRTSPAFEVHLFYVAQGYILQKLINIFYTSSAERYAMDKKDNHLSAADESDRLHWRVYSMY